MVLGSGIDLVEVARFERELARRDGDRFDDVFTAAEIARCEALRRPAVGYAEGFAAKEACFKAIGTGKVGAMSWHDIEVLPCGMKWSVALSGETAEVAAREGMGALHLSIARSRGQVVAWVVGESAL